MRRIPRWPIFTAVVLVLALGGLTSVAIANVGKSFPETSGRLMVSGLKGQVEVLRDSYGVPHIYADNPEDLFAAQGYVHAQDRFYEMDFRRHLAAGRLSELFGASQLETDAYIRTLGWRRVAEQELALLAPSTRRYLDAYAAGVNAYLAGRTAADLSLEYSLLRLQGLRYTPAAWTAVDSVAWLKVMAWDLGSNLTQETDRAIITGKVGAGRAANLFPRYPLEDDFAPIVRRGDVVGKAFDPTASRSSARPLPDELSDDQLRKATNALEGVAKINQAIPGARLRFARGRDGFQLLGRGRFPHRKRQGDLVQRPAPGHLHPVSVGPSRPALPHGLRSLPVRRLRIQHGLHAWGSSSARTPRSRGASPPATSTSRTCTWKMCAAIPSAKATGMCRCA